MQEGPKFLVDNLELIPLSHVVSYVFVNVITLELLQSVGTLQAAFLTTLAEILIIGNGTWMVVFLWLKGLVIPFHI